MIRRTIGIIAVAISCYNPPAIANHISVFDECKRYRIEEEYVKGRIDSYGDYRKGHIETRRERISCNPYGEVAHSYHPHYPHHSYPYPQHAPHSQMPSQAPVVVNNAPVAPIANQCPKVARMGLGGVLGGITGYVVGGGKKSKRTIMNTAIGSGIGAVFGRLTC